MATSVALEGITTLLGHNVRPATPTDAIDGVQPSLVAEPGSIQEAADVLRLAQQHGLAVAPRGGGTKMGWGNIPRRVDLLLSTARLDRVLEHAAGDLVVRVEAGARLTQVQQVLIQAGQWLALDPLEGEATIGGIIAANASGPHRLRYGTVRDLLIGITYLLPDGTVAHAGGKVVKNVAGYDLCKLFTGSLGTLGLIVEAIFRLHPAPAATGTVLWRGADIASALAAVLASPLVPATMEYWRHDEEYELAVRFEGIEAGVMAQVEATTALFPTAETQVLREGAERDFWDSRRAEARAPRDVELVVSHCVTALPATVELLRESGGTRIRGHAGSGITYATLGAGLPKRESVVRAARERVMAEGGSVVIRQAPIEVKQEVEVWGADAGALPLMRRVKDRFDPDGMMNPGRFVGGW
ncbi:MAG: FAD-binding oxidoreductase [Chloroflexota bacterium]|nr:FAD-binding oxidoreductase [Chloroflexota bacterium]